MLTIIGTGSGKAGSMTLEALEAIEAAASVILKTEKCPVTAILKQHTIPFTTLDALFEKAENFDQLNELTLAAVMHAPSPCCYLVHGSACDDTSVQTILDHMDAVIIPGVSVADRAVSLWKTPCEFVSRTASRVLEDGRVDVRNNNVITCLDSVLLSGSLKCILSRFYGDEAPVRFYIEDAAGNNTESSFPLFQLDRQPLYNHTASIFLPAVTLEKVYLCDCGHLLEIMDILTGIDGCPWDKVQTHASLRQYLIEEAYEVSDAILQDDPEKLYDELGDVLLQVAFHTAIGKKCGEFDFDDVSDGICKKMLRRHPHIFAGEKISEDALNDRWEEIKRQEKQLRNYGEVMRDVPTTLPALLHASKVRQKAEKAGLKLPGTEEAVREVLTTAERNDFSAVGLGSLLFTVVTLCRSAGIDPELALYDHTEAFIKSFTEKT